MLTKKSIRLEVPFPERKYFDEYRLSLSVQELFYEKEIRYTYDEYTEHLRLTKEFLSQYPGCTVKTRKEPVFNNISITSVADNLVMISKNRAPAIHFVITHPDLANAVSEII